MTEPSSEFDHLKQWIGKTETCTDVVTPWPVAALAATLDRNDPQLSTGDEIPPGWHWLYCLETTRASALAPDGHPQRGGFLPPVTLARRMWAGGRLDFLRPLRIGDALRRDSRILAIEPKQGKSGSLVFVTVQHTIVAAGEIAVVEEHDIVYREEARPGDPPPRGELAPATSRWKRELTADPVLLFRFSALIFNAHRIHYDLDYVRNVEHYPALVVHGPLQAIWMLDLARREAARPVRRLHYRALLPVLHTERLTVNGAAVDDGSSAELWIATAAGHYAMRGMAYF